MCRKLYYCYCYYRLIDWYEGTGQVTIINGLYFPVCIGNIKQMEMLLNKLILTLPVCKNLPILFAEFTIIVKGWSQ